MLNITPQQLLQTPLEHIPQVLGKVSLFCLNNLYMHFKQTLEMSNTLNCEEYVDKGYESKETKKHKEYINSMCMKNISLSERLLVDIEEECMLRGLDKRFNIVI